MNIMIKAEYKTNIIKFLGHCNFSSDIPNKNSTMARPILYGDVISPPVRFVMMTASVLNIDLKFHKIDLFKNENRSEFFKKINPLQKVPALLVGDTSIVDSHAISMYLCHISKDVNIYPKEPMLRAKVNEMLFYNCSTLFQIDSEILSSFFANKWPINDKIQNWFKALDYLEKKLNENIWLVGSEMRLCDLCAVAVVTSMCHLIPLTNRHCKIKAWITNFEKLPFYYLNQQGLNVLYTRIDNMNLQE